MNHPKVLTAGGAGNSSIQIEKSPMTRTYKRSQNISPMTRRLKVSPQLESNSDDESDINKDLHHDVQPSLSVCESLEDEGHDDDDDDISYEDDEEQKELIPLNDEIKGEESHLDDLYSIENNDLDTSLTSTGKLIWLGICFFGIMFSFVGYGLLLEYATSGGRKLHELSFLFVTSMLYTVTAAAGRYVRDETPTTIPPARFAVLGITSMGSTFCSVRSLRYVIFPIQVLAKSCKPVPVMLMGAFMGKKYPLKKYINVFLIVAGVGLFMGGGNSKKKTATEDEFSSSSQLIGIILLFISLCFDGGTGAYEDKLMAVHSVGPFDLMYNIQLGKTIIAGVALLVLNQVHVFMQMCQDMGFVLFALGFTGAMGQVFIFVCISKFGALTCSIIGLARKVTTLIASIYIYGHHLNTVQMFGLIICIGSMVMNFMGKKNGAGKVHTTKEASKTVEQINHPVLKYREQQSSSGDVEMQSYKTTTNPLTAGGC